MKKKKLTKLTGVNRVLDFAALGVIILTALYLLCAFPTLPTKLARHISWSGYVTYDDKAVVWVDVIIQLAMYGMFTLFARIPSIYENPNIPWKTKRSAKNDLAKYTIMLLCVCNVEVCAMFGAMAVFVTLDMTKAMCAAAWIMTAVILVSIILIMRKMYKISKKEPWEL